MLESLQSEDGLRTVTGLFTNMDFSNGTNGWTLTGKGDLKHDNTGVSVMARMSGWYNIFFCIQDIPIHEGLIVHLYSISVPS